MVSSFLAPEPRPDGKGRALPLCVHLDGALASSNLLLELILLLLKNNPLHAFLIPFWLLRGRTVLVSRLTERVTLNVKVLPYDREFLQWLTAEAASGRHIWLCTALNQRLAAYVAEYLGVFSGVVANDSSDKPRARQVDRLVSYFGERGFDYCGNEWRDLATWKRARAAVVVRGSERLIRGAARHAPVIKTFPTSGSWLSAAIRALRPAQWSKNLLIFLPLLTSHRIDDLVAVATACLAAVSFSLCASSAYLINDLLDLEADRTHPTKSKRPLAAGEIPLALGVLLAPLLFAAALFLAAFLPPAFAVSLVLYYAITLAYSLALKKLVLVDTLTLAGLYTSRIVAGAIAIGVPMSFWLLLFSIFVFLSLALVKRFSELDTARKMERAAVAGRGYIVDDLSIVQSLGSASGMLSVLVLALYINSPETQRIYAHPELLWFLCVLLLHWVAHVWLAAQRGRVKDDPVLFCLQDRTSLISAAVAATITIVAAHNSA